MPFTYEKNVSLKFIESSTVWVKKITPPHFEMIKFGGSRA